MKQIMVVAVKYANQTGPGHRVYTSMSYVSI